MAILFCNTVDLSQKNLILQIPRWERRDDHVVYVIQINITGVVWWIRRRYREFVDFDKSRFTKLKQSLLPPKKFVGNSKEEFLEKRKIELENYIRTVFELEVWLQRRSYYEHLPRCLANFLGFHDYELHAILEELASHWYQKNEQILSSQDSLQMSPLQLWAITQRLNLPEPSLPGGCDIRFDFAHIIDVIYRLKSLHIVGCDSIIGTSNIRMNSLPFSLHSFKSLSCLSLTKCAPLLISGIYQIRSTVKTLYVQRSLHNMKDILCDKESLNFDSEASTFLWPLLDYANFSSNMIYEIDNSMAMLSNLERLDLSDNRLSDIQNLDKLPNLRWLDLSRNEISVIDNWHLKLGNIKRLILCNNKISSIKGLSKIFSLEHLEVQNNQILQRKEIWPIGTLPCLEFLYLKGNPIESSIEYRTRVLEAFGNRASEVFKVAKDIIRIALIASFMFNVPVSSAKMRLWAADYFSLEMHNSFFD